MLGIGGRPSHRAAILTVQEGKSRVQSK